MPTFKGYNSIGQQKKFGITDFDLIKRDLLNAFLTRSGEISGRPDLGTEIWSYIFEPNISEIRNAIENEVRKIIRGDPRLELSSLDITYDHNTVILETAIIISPSTAPSKLFFTFEQNTQTLNIT